MSQTLAQPHIWTREEYDRMVAAGVFDPEARLELINGEIINIAPQGSQHATAVQLVEEALRQSFIKNFTIRVQMPIALDASSEPEPDTAVVIGKPRDYSDAHPTNAVLIIEVADTTLAFDQQQKKKLYARNGIQEYWIINLQDEQINVYRDPIGEEYKQELTLHSGQSITPLTSPSSSISVTDLLP